MLRYGNLINNNLMCGKGCLVTCDHANMKLAIQGTIELGAGELKTKICSCR